MKIIKKVLESIFKLKIALLWQLGNFFIKTPKPADLKKLCQNGQINNILVSELNFIGDKLFITPALRAIKSQYPKIKITVLVKDRQDKKLLANNPNIDEINTAPGYFYCLKNRGKFDVLIDYSANLYWAFILTYAKIPYRIGTKPKQKVLFKKRHGFGWLYTHTKDFPANTYIVDYFLSLLQFLGIASHDNKLEIHLNAEQIKKARNFLKASGLEPNKFIVLHPGSNNPNKAWPWEFWKELALKITSQTNLAVVFTGSGKEQRLIEAIKPDNSAYNSAGKLDIMETAALISEAKLFIGVDTGPLHLAVSQNKPIVAIFNATHPQNYLPQAENIIVLNTPEKCKQQFTMDYIKTNQAKPLKECSRLITPDQVLTAIQKLLK